MVVKKRPLWSPKTSCRPDGRDQVSKEAKRPRRESPTHLADDARPQEGNRHAALLNVLREVLRDFEEPCVFRLRVVGRFRVRQEVRHEVREE